MNNSIVCENKMIITQIENNMREKLKYVASKSSTMHTENIQGVSVVDTSLPSDTFNTAFGGTITAEVAKEVFAYYNKNNQPMAWWIGPNSDSKIARKHLENAGFVHNELDIGMACDLTEVVDDYPLPKDLIISKCTTPEKYAAFGEVLSSIFDPPDEQVKTFYNKMATISTSEIKDMILFIGYERDIPVATSCLFLTDVSGIYDIATRPEKRRLGYGSAMFYHALIESKKRGCKKSILQASPDGLNIYKRFGFKALCKFNVWSNQLK